MVLVQKWPFFQLLFFRQYTQGKCLLRYSRTKKRHSRLQKRRRSKTRKIDVFPKGLTHGIGPKMVMFPTFLLSRYRPEKCLLRYSTTKKTPFQAIKTRSSKSQKIHIFLKRLTHVWSKNGHFTNFFFLGNIAQENVFYNILEGKNAILGYKNKKFKKQKN